GATADSQLAVDVRQVVLDRLLAEPELSSDLLVRATHRDTGEDLPLASRQAELFGGAHRLRGSGSEGLRDELTLEDLPQDRRHVCGIDSPAQERSGTPAKRFGGKFGLVGAREDHDLRLGILLPEAIEYLKAVEPRHPDVEQDEVRLRLADPRQDLAARSRLAHDLDVGLGFEREAHRLENQRVVVRKEKANWPQAEILLVRSSGFRPTTRQMPHRPETRGAVGTYRGPVQAVAAIP